METRKKTMTVKKIFPQCSHLNRISFSLQFGNVPTPLYKTLPIQCILFINTGHIQYSWLQQENWTPSHLSWLYLLLISPKISGWKTTCKVMPKDHVLKCLAQLNNSKLGHLPRAMCLSQNLVAPLRLAASRSIQCWKTALLKDCFQTFKYFIKTTKCFFQVTSPTL